ncbi:MAG: hypothetical protein KF810_24110 [Rhizobiaceae bacterium]|jgi:hypothetical protein|nr:hypothetical protein [Rhizobiaceae bacterium]
MRFVGRAVVILALGVSSSNGANAADISVPATPSEKPIEQDGWRFAVSSYFWAAGLSGDTAQFGAPTVHLDLDFGDILSDLEFAAMTIGEARYQRYSLFADIMYTKTSTDSGTPLGIVAESVGVTSETFAGLVGAGYSILQDDRGYLDVVAGARLWYVNTDLSFSGGVLDGADFNDNAAWIDGMAGVRAKYSLNDHVYVSGWGLIGAGGADIDWDVAAILGYDFNERISAVAGYRALGVDYSKDAFLFDVVQQGPVLGLVVRF